MQAALSTPARSDLRRLWDAARDIVLFKSGGQCWPFVVMLSLLIWMCGSHKSALGYCRKPCSARQTICCPAHLLIGILSPHPLPLQRLLRCGLTTLPWLRSWS